MKYDYKCQYGHEGSGHKDLSQKEINKVCTRCLNGKRGLERAGMPAYQKKTFHTFKHLTDAHKDAANKASGFTHTARTRRECGWLLLHGKTGTGKGHLAGAILNDVCMWDDMTNSTYRYYRFDDMVCMVRGSFNGGRMTEYEYKKEIRAHRLLIIDELSEESMTDWARTFLESILDYRYEMRLPTILITNLAPEAFYYAVGQRIESRFAHIGQRIAFDWGDYRKGDK